MSRCFPLLLLLASCGVFGLTDEKRQALARYQQNAQTYWQNGDLARSFDQARKGLEIDPDDYKLNLLRGWLLWRNSLTKPQGLEPAREQFEKVLAMRSESDHDVRAFYGAGLVHQGLGQRFAKDAANARNQIEHGNLPDEERTLREAKAAAADRQKTAHYEFAKTHFKQMIMRQDLLWNAHYHLVQLEALQDHIDAALEHGELFLAEVEKTEAVWRQELERTTQPAYEIYVSRRLNEIRRRTTETRIYVANLYYQKEQYGDAKAKLDIVLLTNPNRFKEYYNRGRCLLAMGRKAEAKSDFEKFLEATDLPREHPQVAEALKAIRN